VEEPRAIARDRGEKEEETDAPLPCDSIERKIAAD